MSNWFTWLAAIAIIAMLVLSRKQPTWPSPSPPVSLLSGQPAIETGQPKLRAKLIAALDANNEAEAQRLIAEIESSEKRRLQPSPEDIEQAFFLIETYGHDELMKLVRERLHPNVKDATGWPLFFETFHAGVLVFPFFMENGVDKNISGGPGNWTALHLAAASGNDTLFNNLVRGGAESNPQLEDGTTALHLAARTNRSEQVQELCYRADKRLKDRYGKTALFYAVQSEDSFQNFFGYSQHGEGPMVRDEANDGSTLVHAAAEYGSERVLKVLLEEFRLDPNRANDRGETPLHTAWLRTGGPEEYNIPILIEHGGLLSKKDNRGRTPIDAFLERFRSENESLLLSIEGAKTLDGRSKWLPSAAKLLAKWDTRKRTLPMPNWPTQSGWTVYPSIQVQRSGKLIASITRKIKVEGAETLVSLSLNPSGAALPSGKLNIRSALLMGYLAKAGMRGTLREGQELILRFPKSAGRFGGAMAFEFEENGISIAPEPLGAGSCVLREGVLGASRTLIAQPDRFGRKIVFGVTTITRLKNGFSYTPQLVEVPSSTGNSIAAGPLRFPLEAVYQWRLAEESQWNPTDIFTRTERLPVELLPKDGPDPTSSTPVTIPNTVKSKISLTDNYMKPPALERSGVAR